MASDDDSWSRVFTAFLICSVVGGAIGWVRNCTGTGPGSEALWRLELEDKLERESKMREYDRLDRMSKAREVLNEVKAAITLLSVCTNDFERGLAEEAEQNKRDWDPTGHGGLTSDEFHALLKVEMRCDRARFLAEQALYRDDVYGMTPEEMRRWAADTQEKVVRQVTGMSPPPQASPSAP